MFAEEATEAIHHRHWNDWDRDFEVVVSLGMAAEVVPCFLIE